MENQHRELLLVSAPSEAHRYGGPTVPSPCYSAPWNCIPWGPGLQWFMCEFFGKCPR